MLHTPSRLDHRGGTATVEFALVMPVFVIFMLGIWELGRWIEVRQLISSAAREAGREAAAGQLSTASVQQAVYNYLNNAGVQVTDGNGNPLTGVSVTVTDNTNPGTDAAAANRLDYFTLTVTVPYDLFQWVTLSHFVTNSGLSISTGWYSMNNQALTVSQTVPSQPQ